MNIAQRLQDKGRQEGIEQGIERGIEQGIKQEKLRAACNREQERLRTARSLLKNGVSLELIKESIGLSREELISLQ